METLFVLNRNTTPPGNRRTPSLIEKWTLWVGCISLLYSCSSAQPASPHGGALAQSNDEKRTEESAPHESPRGEWSTQDTPGFTAELPETLEPLPPLAPETIAPRAVTSNQFNIRMYPQNGHVSDIYCAAISQDGRFLMTGSRDQSVRLWELESGVLLKTFDTDTDARSVTFSPDGRWGIAGDSNGRIIIWELQSGNRIGYLKTERGSIENQAMKIFPDGRRIAVGYAGNNIHVWNLHTGQLIHVLGTDERRYKLDTTAVRQEAVSLDILPDGKHILGGYASGKIKMWDADRRTLMWEINAHSGSVNSLAISRDGKHVFSGSSDGLKKWNIQSRRMVRHYAALPKVWVVKLISDPTRSEKTAWLALGDNGAFLPNTNQMALLNLDTGTVRSEEEMRTKHYTNAVSVSPDGKVAAAGTAGGSLITWDVPSAEIRQTLRGSNGILWDLAVSHNGLQIATTSLDRNIYLWDAEMMAATAVLRGHATWPNTAVFSPKGNYLLSSSRSGDNLRLWDLFSHRNIGEFDPGGVAKPMHANAIAITPDGQQAVSCNMKCEVRLFALPRGTLTASYNVGENCNAINLTVDGRHLLVEVNGEIQMRELKTGKRIKSIPLPTAHSDDIAVSPDGIHVGISLIQGLFLIDLEKSAVVRKLDGGSYDAVSFSPDGRFIAGGSSDREVNVYEVRTGNQLASYKGHTAYISAVQFSASGNQLVTAAEDGMTKIWNLRTGESVTLLTQDGEWLVYSDDGYFDASRRGGELAAMIRGTKGFRIDQLAVRNNRPDILLERIGVRRPRQAAHFRALYHARVRKLGLNEKNLTTVYENAPEAKVIHIKKEGKYVDLRFEVSAAEQPLVSYNIYVNDVPVHGANGTPLSGRRQFIDERVELSSGQNKIEVSTMNHAGVESLRDSRMVHYKPIATGNLYYLGFGVSTYKDPAFSLKYAAKDATDLEALFRSATGFQRIFTRTYVNEQVTKNAIQNAKAFLAQASVDDTVVLFVAGHGLYGDDGYAKYYYVTHDTHLSRLAQTAADFESIEDLLQGISARRKLFLLDTCQSGELENNVQWEFSNTSKIRNLRSRGIRLAKTQRPSKTRFQGMRNDQSRYIYNDLFRRSGAIVFSSSRGTELSYERDDFKNGVFTEIVLEALSTARADKNRDHRISTDELRDFVSSEVPRVSGDQQHPVVDRDNLYMLFSLPVMPHR